MPECNAAHTNVQRALHSLILDDNISAAGYLRRALYFLEGDDQCGGGDGQRRRRKNEVSLLLSRRRKGSGGGDDDDVPVCSNSRGILVLNPL